MRVRIDLRRLSIGLVGAAGVLGLAVLLGWAALRHALSPVAEGAPATVFTLPRGTNLASVAQALAAEGLVRSAPAFEWLARSRGVASRLHAGEYELSPGFSSQEILERLVEGRVVFYQVVLPEGLRLEEVADRLGQVGLVEAAAFETFAGSAEAARMFGVEGDSLEGYLFPETYRLPRGLTAPEIAATLVSEFFSVWREIEHAAEARKLSMREVATLASIVEKETGDPGERPLIASVFQNRLARGMRLESDPTTIYGIADFDGNLRRVHLEDASNPYNTYQIPGLPPGPIANAGADSLRAVVSPAESDYLYFVSRNDGTHVFSGSYREHIAAVNRYQKGR